MRRQRSQRGVVLISILLIVALLTALTYRLQSRFSLVVAQAQQTFHGDQALHYALGGEAYARDLLFDDWQQNSGEQDTLLEPWAQPLEPFEIEGGFIEIRVLDRSGCFNLNSLQRDGTPVPTERLRNLLRYLDLPIALADSWRDWVDSDEEISGFGAEDGEYLLAEPPYRTANQRAGDVSELRLLAEMEPEWYRTLRDQVCVLPTDEFFLNVNTADAAALMSLSPAVTEAQILPLVESEREFATPGEVTAEIAELIPMIDSLRVTSEYFEINVRAQVDETQVELASLVHRDRSTGRVQLLSRNLGKEFRSVFEVDDAQTPPSRGEDG